MSEIEKDVAVLSDWRRDHADEHKAIWKQFSDQGKQNIDFIKAIEQLQTKMTIYVALAVTGGTVAGTFMGNVFVNYIRR